MIRMGLLREYFISLFILLAQWTVKVRSQGLIAGCPISPIRIGVVQQTDEALGSWTEPRPANSNVELVERSHIPGEALFPVGFTDVDYTFRDTETGEEETCTFTFIVLWVGDEQPPQIQSCPSDITSVISSPATTANVSWVIPTATDNAGPVRVVASHTPPFDFPLGITPVTYTFQDARGFEAICEFNVSILEEDLLPPTINCPGNQSVQAAAGETVAFVRWPEVTATDNGGTPALVSMKPQPGLSGLTAGTFPIGQTTVCYVYSDMVGNTAECQFTVEVRAFVDSSPPVVSCPETGPDVFGVASGSNGQVFWAVPMVISDDSLPVQTESSFNPGDFFPIGTTLVEYCFTDRVGNKARCSFNVVVQDTSPPVFTNCPQRDEVAVIPVGQLTVAVSWETITAVDNSGISPVVTGTHQSGDLFPQGSTMVVLTAEDGSGNPALCTFNVVATREVDPMPIVITGCPSTITIVAPDDQQGATVTWIEPTAEVDSGVPTRVRSHIPPEFFQIGRTQVLYTFTDLAGSTATCPFDVVVLDQTPPDIMNCPASSPIRASLLAEQTMMAVTFIPPTAVDNSQGAVSGDCTHNSGDVFSEGTTVVLCIFTDESGNSNQCMFEVILEGVDTVAPVIMNCPNDITRQATGPQEVIVMWSPLVVTDDSGIQPTRLFGPPNYQGSFAPGTTETVTYIYSDAANNNVECQFTVTIDPAPGPEVDCSGLDLTRTAPFNAAGVTVNSLPSCSATSSVGTVTQVSQTPASGSFFPIGTTTVTNVFQDSNGLRGSGTFTVTVIPDVDNEPPVVDCSGADFTVPTLVGSPGAVVPSLPRCRATDNSGQADFVSQNPVPGSFFPNGNTEVTVVYQDPSGNTGVGSFTVIVQSVDNQPPVVDCSGEDFTLPASVGSSGVVVTSLPRCRATDNSGQADFVSQNPLPGSFFPVGGNQVVVIYRDPSGNTGVGSYTVTVQLEILPVNIVCPNIAGSVSAVSPATPVTWSSPTCTGGVSPLSSSCSPPSGSTFPIGSTPVTCFCVDSRGMTNMCTFDVTVDDDVPPSVDCSGQDFTVTAPAGSSGVIVTTLPRCSATDNSGQFNFVTQNPSAGSSFPIGGTQVTVVYRDPSGNTGVGFFTVTVEPGNPPVSIVCPNIAGSVSAVSTATPVTWSNPTCTGGVSPLSSSCSPPSGSTFPIGSTPVTCFCVDSRGMSNTCTFEVNVDDDVPPSVDCNGVDFTVTASAGLSGVIVTTLPRCSATDNSGQFNFVTQNPSAGSSFPIGDTQVTVVYQDPSGNTGVGFFTVTVEPEILPVNIGCPNIAGSVSAVSSATPVTWSNPTCSGGVSPLSSSCSPPSGSTFPIGSTPVTCFCSDSRGTSNTCTFDVTVVDDVPPSVDCSGQDFTVTAPASSSGVIVTTLPRCSATDNSGQLNFVTQNPSAGSSFPIGDTQVTVVYRDPSGNTGVGFFTVTVEPEILPVNIGCPNIAGSVSAVSSATPVTWSNPTCSGGVSPLSSSCSPPSGSTFPIGSTPVTCFCSDSRGTSNTCTFDVTVDDDVPPSVDCSGQDFTVTAPAGSSGVIVTTLPRCSATDNSGQFNFVTQNPSAGSLFPIGESQVTVLYQDPSGNTGVGFFTVTVEPEILPVNIGCPDIAGSVSAISPATPFTWSDPTCTGGVSPLSSSCSPPSGSTFPIGSTPVTCFCSDSRGTSNTCTFDVTVDDDVPPSVDCSGQDVIITAPAGSSGVIVTTLPICSATDNSGQFNFVTQNPSPGSLFPIGDTQVNVVYRDPSGNTGVGFFTITVEPGILPVNVVCPNIAGNVSAVSSATPVTWSNPTCTGGVSPLSSSCSPPSGSTFPIGSTPVTCFCSDSRGTSNTCTFDVTVDDDVSPSVDCSGQDFTVTAPAGSFGVIVTTLPRCSATDNSGQFNFVAQNPSAGSSFPIGDTQVTVVYRDPSGNTGAGFFTVTVEPDDPVIISCPPNDRNVIQNNDGIAIGLWSNPSCTGGTSFLGIRCDPPARSIFPIGITTVLCTCTDSTGEEDMCSFPFVVVDETPPLVVCSNILVTVPSGQLGTTVELDSCIVSDNSGLTPTLLLENPSSGSFFAIGTTPVTVTYTDRSGNEASDTFLVIVEGIDDEPPVVNCDGLTTSVSTTGTCATVTFQPCTATDNQGAVSLTSQSHRSGFCFPIGLTEVTFQFTDDAGNIGMDSFTVTVIRDDVIPPSIISCPDDIFRQTLITTGGDIVFFEPPTAFDESGMVQVVNDPIYVPGSYFPIGTTPVTYLFVDSSGNIATCTFEVTVQGVNPCDNSDCFNGGVCVALTLTDSVCVCTGCFTGSTCQVSLGACGINRCENGGTCRPIQGSCQAFFCNCPPCYTGLTCQTRVGACRNHECQNGAVCIPASTGCIQYTCQCPSCFVGDFCQIAIPNPCSSAPCLNGGQCSRVPNSCYDFTCTCSTGFSGERCEQVVNILDNPCNSFPCFNQGSCVSFGSTYKCICRPGLVGRNCQRAVGGALSFDGCIPNSPCQNGGTCFESYTSTSGFDPFFSQYTCVCGSGFTGERCAIPVNQAPGLNRCLETNICQNGGTCRNSYCSFQDRVDFFCECPIGFIGEVCSIPYDNPCSTSPCSNGGVCQPFNLYFVCSCLPGYSGITCEQLRDITPPTVSGCPQQSVVVQAPQGSSTAVVSWSEPTAVDNSGQPVELASVNARPGAQYPVGTLQVVYVFEDVAGNQNTCIFSITVLEATDACNPNPCQNGGNCQLINGRFLCICPSGFTGQTCSQGVSDNPCDSSPCLNGGTCVMLTSDLFVCLCETGVDGMRCENAQDGCSTRPCQNGGTCVPTGIGNFVCLCNTGFQGTVCQSVIGGVDVSAPDIMNCPGNTTVTFVPGVNFVQVSWTAPTATDESPPIQQEENQISPTFLQRGRPLNVIYVFSDRFGNTATCSFFFIPIEL